MPQTKAMRLGYILGIDTLKTKESFHGLNVSYLSNEYLHDRKERNAESDD